MSFYKFHTLMARFYTKMRQHGRSECWVWRGSMANGTPSFWMHGRPKNARRVSFVLFSRGGKAILRAGYTVLPDVCGNVRCVNPAHLVRHFRPVLRGGITLPDPFYLYEDEKP